MNVDWEMKARHLAEDLRLMAFVVVVTGAGLLVVADGLMGLVGVWLMCAGFAAMHGARIEP